MRRHGSVFSMSTIGSNARPGAASRLRVAAVVGSLVLLFSVGLSAQDSDRSLADVARQSKGAHKAARVVTNDEIPSVTPDPGPQTSAALSENNRTASSDKPSSAAGRPETRGTAAPGKGGITVPGVLANGTLQEAQNALDTLKHDRQLLKDNYDKIERKLAETNDDSLRQVYSESLARRDTRLAEKDKSIAQLENAIRAARDAQGGNNETQ
jgi:hypothetical protein